MHATLATVAQGHTQTAACDALSQSFKAPQVRSLLLLLQHVTVVMARMCPPGELPNTQCCHPPARYSRLQPVDVASELVAEGRHLWQS
jgi:hypothetical protein